MIEISRLIKVVQSQSEAIQMLVGLVSDNR
jgi:hypothetical protein